MTSFSSLAREAALDSLVSQMDGGKVQVWSGVRPASADDAPTGSTLVLSFDLPTPAFAPATGGDGVYVNVEDSMALLDLTPPITALATANLSLGSGDAWVRVVDSSGNALMDDSCGGPSDYGAWLLTDDEVVSGDTATLSYGVVIWDAGDY